MNIQLDCYFIDKLFYKMVTKKKDIFILFSEY